MKRILIPLFVCILLAPSCMKYEDGPCISFRSQYHRLQGEWLLKYFTVDGTDSLQILNNYFGGECQFTFFPRNEGGEHPFTIQWGITSSNYYNVTGNIGGFYKEFLTIGNFSEDSSSTLFPLSFLGKSYPNSVLNEWILTKLKYNDVWLEVNVNQHQYELHLENTKKF